MTSSRAALTFVLLSVFIDSLGFGIIIPSLPGVIMKLTGEPVTVAADWGGYLMAVYALLQFFMAPVFGNLSDRFGRRPILLGSLFALVAVGRFPVWPVAIIAVREISISLYRVYWGRRGLAVPARRSAKLKTLVQSLAVGAVLMPPLTDVTWLADGLLYIGTFLAVLSAVQYVLDGSRAATTMGDRPGLTP